MGNKVTWEVFETLVIDEFNSANGYVGMMYQPDKESPQHLEAIAVGYLPFQIVSDWSNFEVLIWFVRNDGAYIGYDTKVLNA